VEEKKEKIEYLNSFQRLEQKGFQVSRRFTMDNGLDEIKQEYMRLVDAKQLETSLRFQRQALIGVVTGMEWLNGRFDPFDIKLDGWSESVHENVEDFDEIFEELVRQVQGPWQDAARDAPDDGACGLRFHVPREQHLPLSLACRVPTMFSVRIPTSRASLRQRLRTRLDLASATSWVWRWDRHRDKDKRRRILAPPGQPGAFFQPNQQQQRAPQAVAAVEQQQQQQQSQTARREMKGPSGVDDILSPFQQARERDMSEVPQSSAPQGAVAAAVEIQSMDSEDIQSMAESTRTGRTGGRRRRAVVGDTVKLNV
jgi:hypothetical protein